MEIARIDCSCATFFGVHSGLAMGSIFLCGSEEQKQKWLRPWRGWKKSVPSASPSHSSAQAPRAVLALQPEGKAIPGYSTDKRSGSGTPLGRLDHYLGSRSGRWPGEGLIVENNTPGFTVEKITTKWLSAWFRTA